MDDAPSPGLPGTAGAAPPPRQNVLVLQGGGALGAYQAGVYDALASHQTHIDWVAGVSIGAINGAIIAGNAPEHRVERLHRFWNLVTELTAAWPDPPNKGWQTLYRGAGAASALLFGAPGFFHPQPVLDWFSHPAPLSFYDTSELRSTLERLIDFDRINRPGGTRLSVGAVNVETGNLIYFDSGKQRIRPEHIMASGALPPGLAVVEIDGDYYWDGGLVSNTPLQYVLDFEPHADMLIFQVDLFPARGRLPENLDEVAEREKDIRYSSRTRTGTENAMLRHQLRASLSSFLESLPADLQDNPVTQRLRAFAHPKMVDIVHLIYRPPVPQGSTKDFQFVRGTIEQRWTQGRHDAHVTMRAAPWNSAPANGARVFDVLAPASAERSNRA